jgi:N-formylglutamate deformylase
MTPFTLHRGTAPLVVSVPHAGTFLPDAVAADLAPAARDLPDTDFHVDKLVAFAGDLGATVLVANHARMHVDLNRPADDAPMYPGQAGTGLVPETLFDGTPAWTRPLTGEDKARRVEAVWRPYHEALRESLDAAKARHGHAVLWDAHSIRGRVPRLFEGRLPDLNLGTNSGASCSPGLREAAAAVLAAAPFTHVVDGRFKGGHITRHYGQPDEGVHAVQLEMAWHAYLDERRVPPAWDPARAASLIRVLRAFAEALLGWRP